jgi:uncharacterized repeat protein (TIGR01451 family)
MKKSLSLISLLLALSAAAAGATGTTAGTSITNTATINFNDDAGAAQPSVNSNTVSTTVLPVPSFTVLPNQTTVGTVATDAADYAKPGQTSNAKPGDIVAYPYTLTNTGNVAAEGYDLSTPSVGGSGSGLAAAGVRYYSVNPDTNADGIITAAELGALTAITTITGVAKDASVTFYQVYTLPVAATNGQTFGSSPTGTRKVNAVVGSEPAGPFTQPFDSNNANLTTVQRTDAVALGPKTYPDGNAPVATPITYPSVDAAPVTVTESGDTQTAPATVTTTRITFTNTVRNDGNRGDVLNISVVPANLPAGATYRILDSAGTVLVDTNADGKVDLGTLAAGASKDLRIEVTLIAGSTSAVFGTQPTFTVTATSSNDVTKSNATTDTVLLPGAVFGDKTATDPAPATVVNQNATAPAAGGNPATSTSNTLSTIPMQIKNNGGSAEAFTPTGSVTFSTPAGPVTRPVTYLPDANCDGTADTATPITTTPSVAPGASYCLIPVVSVPDNAYPGAYTLTQTATGATSGVVASDSNDTITIPKVAGAPSSYIVKAVDKASAKPGDTLTYTIAATNTGNANIRNVIAADFLPANTTFVSLSTTTTVLAPGKVMYRVGNTVTTPTTWSATAPSALAASVQVEVGVDSNNDNTINNSDILKPGEHFDVTFKVTVN